jgi:hypothetical protein
VSDLKNQQFNFIDIRSMAKHFEIAPYLNTRPF